MNLRNLLSPYESPLPSGLEKQYNPAYQTTLPLKMPVPVAGETSGQLSVL